MEDKHCPGLDPKLYSVIVEKCLHTLGLPVEYSAIGGGECGKAFLANGKVYKISTDKSEAIESAKLIGKRNYHIADIYDAKQIHTTLTQTPIFLIVLEKLRTDRDSIFYEMQEELTSIFQQELGEHLFDVLYHYRFDPTLYKNVYEEEVNYILNTHQREKFYYNSLLSICDELRKNNIESLDLQYHNLGLKPNGNLAFFDLGFGEEKSGHLSAVDIGEQIYERVMSYMKGSSAMKVKKKCQLGGLGNGKSVACNQGDISNIELSPIKEEVFYRVDSGFMPPRGSTALDVIKYEMEENGNVEEMEGALEIAKQNGIDLSKVSSRDIVWVTKTPEDALRYEPDQDINNVDHIQIDHPLILADDGDNGYLILMRQPLQEHTSRWNKMLQRKWKDIGKTEDASPEQMEAELRKKKAISVTPEEIKAVIDYEVNKNSPTFEPMAEEGKIGINDLPFKTDVEQAGGKIYSVGGAVRDNILGRESKDLDLLITGIPLDKLEEILHKYGKVDNVGKSFGIIKFNTPQTGELDIAIPRTERKNAAGGYQGFDVTSDHTLPIEKDLERRDFTINAIAKDSSGLMIDPYGGQGDIEKKQIKMVNPQAFSDDPLRMLRAVQFAARFNFNIEPQTMHEIQKNASKIREISPERILIEFDKIVKKGNPLVGAKLLRQSGLYDQIFGVSRGINLADFNKVKTMGEFIYELIKNAVPNPAEFFKNNLKGDIDTYNEIKALQIGGQFKGDRKTIFDMYKTYPKSIDTQVFGENFTNSVNFMKQHNIPFSLKDVPVNGNDLMEMGYQGKQIGDLFVDILSKIYKEELPNQREDILNYVKSLK